MSLSSSTIRSLFNSQVFQHATVQGYTDKVFSYDVLSVTNSDFTELFFEQEVNFFTFTCLREIDYDHSQMNGNGNSYGYRYTITIDYYLEVDPEALAYNKVVDRLEAVDDLIISELGLRWDSNIDRSEQISISQPEIIEIEEVECWTARLVWQGFKFN